MPLLTGITPIPDRAYLVGKGSSSNIGGSKSLWRKSLMALLTSTTDLDQTAFKIILYDKNVKGILINIFGGIMRCDVLAEGVVEAAKEIKIDVPLIVRLAGTKFEEGKKILDNSGLKIISASDLSDAAKKVVNAIK